VVEAYADEAEAGRKLPDALVEAFIDARFFQLSVPRELGGAEIDFVESVRVIEELARSDGSAGWNVMIGAGNGRYGALMAPEVAAEVYADPRAVWCAAFPVGGRLAVTEGGYRLSGRWPYASGCSQSSWFFPGCLVAEGEHARRTEDGRPLMLIAVLPRKDWRIVETWNTSGLRGTGSHDIVVNDVFVPAERTFNLGAPTRIDSPLYRIPPFSALGPGGGALTLGIARHAIEAFIQLAKAKRHAVSNTLAQDRPVAQMRLSEAEGLVRAARAFYYESLESIWKAACEGRTPSLEERAMLRIACVTASQASTRAVDLVLSVSGSSAIQASVPLERCWRDVHAAATHATIAEVNHETTGKVLLGIDRGLVLL
jgi:alkylation response protein AidB-like acyl-CoA dehydrogenase